MGTTNGVDAKEKPSTRALPDTKTLQEAGELMVKDEKGNQVAFKSLFDSTAQGQTKNLIVFVRHFFCGFCEEYVRALAKDLPPSVLSAQSTTLTIIGCGGHECIADYKTRTSCPYEIYADPTRKIYAKLGMISNIAGGKTKPDYVTKSTLGVVLSSTWNAISKPSHSLKGGPASQNGGEWLFEGGELKWCHRMANTADHAEVKELKEVLGVQ